MKIRRRAFLLLSGAAIGGVAVGASRAFFTAQKSASVGYTPEIYPDIKPQTNIPNSLPDSQNLVAVKRSGNPNPAPKGMYAPKRGDVRIAVISDLNSQYGSTTYEREVLLAVKYLPEWEPDIVICSGDMVAGQFPSLTESQIRAMWAGFDRNIGEPIRKMNLPYGFTLGNHDASSALSVNKKFLFQTERDLAKEYWNNPKSITNLNFVDRGQFPFYYTFEQNQIFYLIWDASSSHIPPSQLKWAEKSLASSKAQSAKMRIVIGHLPLYAVAIGREDLGEIVENGDKVRQMLEKYNVHTYISGHDHAYYPAHIGKLQLLHTGALGGGPRPLLSGNLPVTKTLTIVDVDYKSADTVYTSYNMTTEKVVDQKILPRVIAGPTGTIYRRDLELSDLTPAERSLKFIPS
jgi:3',5'-cyclic AMP phosphodiesterase CpdA